MRQSSRDHHARVPARVRLPPRTQEGRQGRLGLHCGVEHTGRYVPSQLAYGREDDVIAVAGLSFLIGHCGRPGLLSSTL